MKRFVTQSGRSRGYGGYSPESFNWYVIDRSARPVATFCTCYRRKDALLVGRLLNATEKPTETARGERKRFEKRQAALGKRKVAK